MVNEPTKLDNFSVIFNPARQIPYRSAMKKLLFALILLGLAFSLSAQDAKIQTVVIDPGHGGHDPGALSTDGKVKEKDLALAISLSLAEQMRERFPSVKVLMTRDKDRFVELHERAAIANRAEAQLFISIHINKGPSASACGPQVFSLSPDKTKEHLREITNFENSVIFLEEDYQDYYQDLDENSPEAEVMRQLTVYSNISQGHELAGLMYKALREVGLQSNRSADNRVLQSGFLVLRRTSMPSVLVEIGYITNPSNLAVMTSADGQKRIAGALCDAFASYRESVEGSTAPEKKEENDPAPERPAAAPDAEVYYGIQVTAVARVIPPEDRFFHGYPSVSVKMSDSRLYKYIVCPSTSLDEVKASRAELQKKGLFKDSFIVKVSGEKVSRVQ